MLRVKAKYKTNSNFEIDLPAKYAFTRGTGHTEFMQDK